MAENTVSVSIVVQQSGISRVGFGVPAVLSNDAALVAGFTQRAREYSSLIAAAVDFGTTTATYRLLQSLFSQTPRPSRVIVGRRSNLSTRVVRVTPTAVNSTVYTVTINGIASSFTSDASATVAEIAAGLAAAINANAAINAVVTATDNTTHVTVTSDVPGRVFSLTVSDRAIMTINDLSTDPGVAADITSLRTELTGSDDWYTLLLDTVSGAEIAAAAAAIEASPKTMIFSTQDGDVLSNAGGNIGAVTRAAGYVRSAGIYNEAASVTYPHAAAAGYMLPIDPGGVILGLAGLAGVSPSKITDTEANNLRTNNLSRYVEEFKNAPRLYDGRTAQGRFFDITRDIDKATQFIKEEIFTVIDSVRKLPYTDTGVNVVRTALAGAIQELIADGIFAATPEPVISVPLVADVSATDRANRLLPDVTFTANLAGAIQQVEISGSVQV